MTSSCWFVLFLFGIFSVNFVTSARILGVFPSPGYSQFILCQKLMQELAFRGHEVTVISAFKPKEELKNYKTILVDGILGETESDLFSQEESSVLSQIVDIYSFGWFLTDIILKTQDVQNLIRSNQSYDLVIVEQFFNEAHMGFADHFKAPLILFSSIGLSEWNGNLLGNIQLSSVVPNSFSGYSNRMGFVQRLRNTVIQLFDSTYKSMVVLPWHQKLIDKYFPRKINLHNIMYNASLMLLNSHFATTETSMLTTSMVEIGGFHVSNKKPPEDVKEFLDSAENGAILFSMGTNLNSTNLGEEKIQAVLNVVKMIKQNVLWKFEADNIPNKPRNLFISKWLPQSDILHHPNTVAFISHGGLLSTTEAIHAGVPLIGIPIFGDQKMNVARMVSHGLALHLPFQEFNEDNLYKAINEVVYNPSYRNKALKGSAYLRDRVVPPMDNAMFWIEYVLRYRGASHLNHASLDLYWFQLYLLDVYLVLICFLFMTGIALKYILSSMLDRVRRKSKRKVL